MPFDIDKIILNLIYFFTGIKKFSDLTFPPKLYPFKTNVLI